MNSSFSYNTAFILDKAHFTECFEQSVVVDKSVKAYYKAIVLFIVGLVLLFVVGTNYYAAFFVVGLGVLEALSIKYRKSWWLMRQMLSKASNSKITLIINERGITTESFHVNSVIEWSDVIEVTQTEKGLLIIHLAGTNYISNSCLSDEAIDFIVTSGSKQDSSADPAI